MKPEVIMDEKSKLLNRKTPAEAKPKYSFRFKPEVSKMIDTHLAVANLKYRGDFVERAVKYYCLALDGESESEVLCTEIGTLMKGIVAKSENRLWKEISKLVYNHTLTNRILAKVLKDLSDDALSQWQAQAKHDTNVNYGYVPFKDALDDERNEQEDESCRD